PPRGQVVGPAVLVLEVVRVLPDVDAEERRLPIGDRTVLVRRRHDGQAGAVPDEPGPAAAEALDPSVVHLLLKRLEASENGGDRFSERAGGLAAAAGAHDLPEEGVVCVA